MNNQIFLEEKLLKIGKLGYIKYRGLSNNFPNTKIHNVTVIKDSDGSWYASILVKQDVRIDQKHKLEKCGIDLGVKNPVTVVYAKNGKKCAKIIGKKYSKNLDKKEKQRKFYQKQMSRKQKGSNNWKKGTINKPGKNVRFKSILNRGMLRLGHSNFIEKLRHKTYKYGTQLNLVNPKNTSITCSKCNTVSSKSRKSQAIFCCIKCNYKQNADINAAYNIFCLA